MWTTTYFHGFGREVLFIPCLSTTNGGSLGSVNSALADLASLIAGYGSPSTGKPVTSVILSSVAITSNPFTIAFPLESVCANSSAMSSL